MIIVTTAFVALMGLVGGGGELINARAGDSGSATDGSASDDDYVEAKAHG